MSLRNRLVLIVLGLTAVGLLLANALGLAILRGVLVERLDAQLAPLRKAAVSLPMIKQVTTEWGLLAAVTKRAAENIHITTFDAAGRMIPAASLDPEKGPDLGDVHEIPLDKPFTAPGVSGEHSWRVQAVASGDGRIVVMALSMRQVEETERALTAISLAVSGGVLLVLGLAAEAAVRLGLLPLTRMERTATRIAAGDFGRRMHDTDSRTEPGRLGAAMNVMLDRLEREIAARTESEARLRRFLADASHELRTPLTSVRGFAELYRRGGGDTDEMMRRIEDEAARMGVLVNDLLTLAQLDEERPIERGSVDLLEVAADTVRDARARRPDRSVKLTGRLEPVTVPGDAMRLRQVAANLVDNALVHTDAPVRVRVGRAGGCAVLEVSDDGPGVPPEHAPHVFDRLYRVSQGRSRAHGGAGLGLSIVAAIARAHGGRVELDTAPGRGATFRVLLPLSQAVPSSP
ncbi:sensor histidine kinase [Thermoactinospora rubra]|uniref:sensor histidine kinase n=1 Tax=Thermoactinospora rubra TaxID=1088767 RepID=UPI000A122114|nr:HAMP domain-containing sensor histidine kinase [Thermoactinospora rubra]